MDDLKDLKEGTTILLEVIIGEQEPNLEVNHFLGIEPSVRVNAITNFGNLVN